MTGGNHGNAWRYQAGRDGPQWALARLHLLDMMDPNWALVRLHLQQQVSSQQLGVERRCTSTCLGFPPSFQTCSGQEGESLADRLGSPLMASDRGSGTDGANR